MTDYMKLAQDVVAKAASQGVDAEAIVTNEVETEIKVDRGEIEQLSQSGSLGLGVRVIKNGQTGYAYTSDFSESSIDDTDILNTLLLWRTVSNTRTDTYATNLVDIIFQKIIVIEESP